ncbi:MAG: tyrosine-type recombinase/integrase [Magnetococcales bacterium]|nr:tyrosine-type recombinase/integrase [Magnetococcales bacterium]
MPLSDTTIRNAKPAEKPFKLTDGDGMYLLVNKAGRYFRLDYSFAGTRKTLALGVYPEVSLKLARERRDDARRLLANGIDPSAQKRAEKAANPLDGTFEVIARQWIEKMVKPTATEKHTLLVTRRLEIDAFPAIGARQIRDLRAPDILALLEKMEQRGVIVSAHRVRQIIGQVFRFAVASGKADFDPTSALRGALTPVKEEHHPTITDPAAIGELLRAIDGYAGSFVSMAALRLAPLVFVRPGELRQAEWTEFDLDASEWRIPGTRMKMRELHIVPLSRQAVAILRELHPLTGHGRYVFPGARSDDRPMSENTVNAALRRMGYEVGQMTGHGFRSMASTLLNEMGWGTDAIERQLSHDERNSVRAAYNSATYMPERKRMMQAWADHLDQLAGRNVVPMRAAKA